MSCKKVITAPKNALLSDVLNVLDEKSISSIPITDEENKVIGLCYKSDVTFITKASDPDSVMNNLSSLLVGDIVSIQQQQQRSGEALSTSQASLCKCRMGDSIKSLLTTMMTARVSRVVLVDDMDRCLGIISIKDIEDPT